MLAQLLTGNLDSGKLRKLGQTLIEAADARDAKQAALDSAFAQITSGMDALKKL